MNRLVTLCLSFFVLSSVCSAQPMHACKFSGTSFIGHSEGISTEHISIIEKKQTVGAIIFLPDASGPIPAIVFTHSAIHGPYSSTDLLGFARALARAGAASIVLEGAIEWQSPNDESIRPAEFRFCAGQWMFQNLNLDLDRLANAGNFKVGWNSDDVPGQCGIDFSGKAACWPGGFGVGFGQTTPVESRNTDLFLKPDGELFFAQAIQKRLKLKEIDPAWLAGIVKSQLASSDATASVPAESQAEPRPAP